jgi:hypothetical protein
VWFLTEKFVVIYYAAIENEYIEVRSPSIPGSYIFCSKHEIRNTTGCWAPVAHTCNSSYRGARSGGLQFKASWGK